jgi:hypothetical protein
MLIFYLGLPLIGALLQVPPKHSWLKFAEWGREYGPIYKVEICGTRHIWISREQIAIDLLSKRSAIYSDRPNIPNCPNTQRSGDYLPLLGNNG